MENSDTAVAIRIYFVRRKDNFQLVKNEIQENRMKITFCRSDSAIFDLTGRFNKHLF